MSAEIAKHEEGHEVLELCGPMLLPLLCNLAICLWISHIVLAMRDMWGTAGKPTRIVRLQSLEVEIIHRILSLYNINKIRSPKKNLKHVSIELWHFFENFIQGQAKTHSPQGLLQAWSAWPASKTLVLWAMSGVEGRLKFQQLSGKTNLWSVYKL